MFDQTQSEILDGLLIGDGYIPRNQGLFYFGQRRDDREYVELVARKLGVPVERVKDRTRKPDRRTGKVYACSELRTLSHPAFAEFRRRWYRDGKKVVPRDLNASPEFLLHTINGWSCDRIARKFETSYFSIRYVLKNHYGISFGKNPTAETTCREGVVAPSETIRRAFASCE